jgi:hypothetical protein
MFTWDSIADPSKTKFHTSTLILLRHCFVEYPGNMGLRRSFLQLDMNACRRSIARTFFIEGASDISKFDSGLLPIFQVHTSKEDP